MSMASMVQMFAKNEIRDQHMSSNVGGYNNSAASLFSFNASSSSSSSSSSAPASIQLLPCNNNIEKLPINNNNVGAANAIWELDQAKKNCPQMEGPFTPAPPLHPSAGTALLQHLDHHHHHHHHQTDDHCSPYIDARNINAADFLSFSHDPPHLPAAFDHLQDFPSLPDDSPLHDQLMGLHRKLNSAWLYTSSYIGDADDEDDHDDLPQASMAAAVVEDQHDRLMHGDYGDEVKLCNLARSFTFPPSHAEARCCGARSPLIFDSDAGEINQSSRQMYNNNIICRDNSSSVATTSCSHGDEENEHKAKDVRLKIEASEVTHCALRGQDEQGSTPQKVIPLRQSKKRSANMSNSSTSGKVARLDTPPDVVHVRARRGQATDSHSLAERVRREKISQRMKVLQEIVPGCHKVLGKAMMLDEIINYVKSLQKQVEFLSLKLAAANQAGMTSMLTSEGNFLIPGVEFLGDLNSLCHFIKSEQLMSSSIQ